MAQITFTNALDFFTEFNPIPASECIPVWYKELSSYVNGSKKPTGDGNTTGTIKRCMPVFDSLNSGYILRSPVDVYVSQKDAVDVNGDPLNIKVPWYEWPSGNPIEFHPVKQAPNHPFRGSLPDGASYPKWINPWAIKTPKGYSTFFTQPFHRDLPFTILPGIVDTDLYDSPVNFPFVLNDWSFEGLIPAGTPIVQVIPFKRESWKMGIGGKKEIEEQNKTTRLLKTTFFDGYKNRFRSPKEYK